MISLIKFLIGYIFVVLGVVVLISMLMVMKNKIILVIYYCELDNLYIQFKESLFVLCKENCLWIRKNQKLRMGIISMIGISGINVYVVIEEYILDEQLIIYWYKELVECLQVIVFLV